MNGEIVSIDGKTLRGESCNSSNEITVIELLELKDTIVTTLHDNVELFFDCILRGGIIEVEVEKLTTHNKNHGRIET